MLREEHDDRDGEGRLLEDRADHQRPISRWISGDHQKDYLPGDGYADKTIVELRMCDHRRVVVPGFGLQKIFRQEHNQAVNTGDQEYDFGEFHLRGCLLSGRSLKLEVT